MRTRLLALALASGFVLPCQQPASPFRFAPADAAIVLRVAAPAKWREQFAKTQIAKVFTAPTLGPLVQQLNAMIDRGLASMRESGGFDADLVEKLLTDYKGEIVVALTIDYEDLAAAMAEDRPPHLGVTLALTPDASYDLAALAAAITTAAVDEAPPEGFRDLQVGDVRLRYAASDGEPQTAVPALVDGHLVLLVSDDLAKFAPQALDTKDRYRGAATAPTTGTTAAGGNASTLHVHVQLAPIVKALRSALAEAPTPFDLDAVLEAVGLGALHSATMSIGADGKYLAADGELRLGPGERGMFAMFPSGRRPTKLVPWIPPGSDSFSVTTVDIGALYTMVGRVWEQLGDAVPMTWDQAQVAFAEGMKVRLKEDLIDHLGMEMLTVQNADATAGAPADEQDPLAGVAGMCVGITLKNGTAFGESLEKMMRARGLHAARKTEQYQGSAVHRLTLAGLLELEYAVTDDLLLVALGNTEAARAALRGVLDTRTNPAAAAELPAPVTERLARLPADWSGLSVTSMPAWFAMMATMVEQSVQQAVGETPQELAGVLAMLQQLGGDLERLGLQTMVSTGHVGPDSFAMRARW